MAFSLSLSILVGSIDGPLSFKPKLVVEFHILFLTK